MKKENVLILSTVVILAALTSIVVYKTWIEKPQRLPYVTQRPQRRTIKKVIETTGKLRVAEKIKVGSLVKGIIKKLYVEENQWVNKGQLLAEIDTGKNDADVRLEQGNLQKVTAQYEYQKKFFTRQKSLYRAGQISTDTFEQVHKDYLVLKGELLAAQAKLDKATQEFQNRKIFAPQEGVIIKVGITEGERVTTDLKATVLFEIARDVTKMETLLEIDEGNIGNVTLNQPVKFTVDSFPQKTFKTSINKISYSPQTKSGNLHYKAIVPVDNAEKLLRPGMTVHAKIFIAKTKKALAITSQAFMISPKVIKELAKDIQYAYCPACKEELKAKKQEPIKTVWTVNKEHKQFVEKVVTTNLTDDIYFEITSGIHQDDNILIDIEESSHLEALLKKAYGNKF